MVQLKLKGRVRDSVGPGFRESSRMFLFRIKVVWCRVSSPSRPSLLVVTFAHLRGACECSRVGGITQEATTSGG